MCVQFHQAAILEVTWHVLKLTIHMVRYVAIQGHKKVPTTVCWLTWITSSPAWIFLVRSAGDYRTNKVKRSEPDEPLSLAANTQITIYKTVLKLEPLFPSDLWLLKSSIQRANIWWANTASSNREKTQTLCACVCVISAELFFMSHGCQTGLTSHYWWWFRSWFTIKHRRREDPTVVAVMRAY